MQNILLLCTAAQAGLAPDSTNLWLRRDVSYVRAGAALLTTDAMASITTIAASLTMASHPLMHPAR